MGTATATVGRIFIASLLKWQEKGKRDMIIPHRTQVLIPAESSVRVGKLIPHGNSYPMCL